MKKVFQTKFYNPPHERGSCFPAVIASFMDKDSDQEVIQIQDHYPNEGELYNGWLDLLLDFFNREGWEFGSLDGHKFDDSYYLVTGMSSRGCMHVCIYQNGELFHDPHPSQEGLIDEKHFEYLEKTIN